MSARLSAAFEASALLRLAEDGGGFGMVLRKGDPESGTILIVVIDSQGLGRSSAAIYERIPDADGSRAWTLAKTEDQEDRSAFQSYLDRRIVQDRDLWVVELTIRHDEQFIRNLNKNENKPRFVG